LPPAVLHSPRTTQRSKPSTKAATTSQWTCSQKQSPPSQRHRSHFNLALAYSLQGRTRSNPRIPQGAGIEPDVYEAHINLGQCSCDPKSRRRPAALEKSARAESPKSFAPPNYLAERSIRPGRIRRIAPNFAEAAAHRSQSRTRRTRLAGPSPPESPATRPSRTPQGRTLEPKLKPYLLELGSSTKKRRPRRRTKALSRVPRNSAATERVGLLSLKSPERGSHCGSSSPL